MHSSPPEAMFSSSPAINWKSFPAKREVPEYRPHHPAATSPGAAKIFPRILTSPTTHSVCSGTIRTERSLTAKFLEAALVLASTLGWSQPVSPTQDTGAKQDVKAAGHDTKDAATDAGHAVKETTVKAAHATENGTKKAANATERETKKSHMQLQPTRKKQRTQLHTAPKRSGTKRRAQRRGWSAALKKARKPAN